MLRALGLIFSAVALFALAGGHWAALQGVAWAEMLRAYSQQSGSIAVAVEQTFDGQHPCELCHAIAAAKSRDQGQNPAIHSFGKDSKAKAVLVVKPGRLLAERTVGIAPTIPAAVIGSGRVEQPPTPPPRSGSAAA